MKTIIATVILILIMNKSYSQSVGIDKEIFDLHETIKEKALYERRFKHTQILPLIEKLKKTPIFDVSVVGKSFEKRDIFQIKIGSGPTKVLLWSQMHGDEATATMALFDIFNFFTKKDTFEDFKADILKNCTLYFVPMLNPDGAERFIRRNALGIDLNRDAVRLQSPEAVLLKKLQNELKPEFGFNLHDQSPRYAVGKTGKQATIAFLATAYNEAREINPTRKRSMQLIVGMKKVLQNYIPNQIARFSDEFEPRAFGDNIQKWGTTLILIESGGFGKDSEKQFIRKLNFVTILSSLSSIAKKDYENEEIKDYELIPENNRTLFDILIRNATVNIDGQNVIMDIGINNEEVPAKSAKKYTLKATIEDLGDLSVFFGIEEIDATGLVVQSENPLALNKKADFNLLKDGQVVISIKNGKQIKR